MSETRDTAVASPDVTRLQPDVVAWLLDADPAIRWQVKQDLLDEDPATVAAERARVATTGWGAALLSRQDEDGRWAGAYYNPKWTSTTYTLLLLHWLGLPPGHPDALRGVTALLDGAERFDGGLTFPDSTARYPEGCITSMVVLVATSNGSTDPRVEQSVRWLLGQQLPDGGWNCESIPTGSQHSSFHTSISALDALVAYRAGGGEIAVDEAIRRGQGFFLDHRLYRSHRTGAVVDEAFARFAFPSQWCFDVLRGLEHFRATGAPADPRLADAIDVVRRGQRPDGRWPGHPRHEGDVWFELDDGAPGKGSARDDGALGDSSASRWTTLRALRVLRWWDAATA